MAGPDKLIAFVAGLIRALSILNIACACGFVIAVVISFPAEALVLAHLHAKYGAIVDSGSALNAMRLLMTVGSLCAVPIHRIFVALLAIIASVRSGDPFASNNAARVATIGWGLLLVQCLDLCLGAFAWWFARLGLDTLDWSPSIVGWLSVLVAFVMARVFAVGARMRDDLDGTV